MSRIRLRMDTENWREPSEAWWDNALKFEGCKDNPFDIERAELLDCNLETVARATANRIHTETRMWMEADTQERYVAMYRAALKASHLYIRITERAKDTA